MSRLIMELGVRVLKGVRMSGQEASWVFLKMGISEGSRQVAFIPTMPMDERTRLRKDIKALQYEEDKSTDVWKLSIVNKFEKRGNEPSGVTLVVFSAWYTQGSNGEHRRREADRVIRYRSHTTSGIDNFKRDCYAKTTFRSEADHIVDIYHEIYDTNIEKPLEKKR